MILRKHFSRNESIAGLLSIALCTGCAHTRSIAPDQALRNPASTSSESADLKPSPLNSLDTVLFSDVFHVDTQGKRIKRTMKTRFWTDIDAGYLREGASAAFERAVLKTLTDENDPSMGFAKKLQSNLIEGIMKEFVMTLQVYKIVNKTLQFDVYFLPSLDTPDSLRPEFSNNGLVQLEQKSLLSSELARLDSWRVTSALSSFAKESSALVPRDESGHRLIGSVLTFSIKILDMDWDPSRPIPKPKQNAVKGFVRVRRYFAGTTQASSPVRCSGDLTLNSAQLQGNAAEHWTTVDAIYSFNLASFLPKADHVEIFPGRLMAPNQGSGDLLPKGPDFAGKTLKSGELQLKFAKAGEPDFSISVRKLSYSFGGTLDRNTSDIRVPEEFDPTQGTWSTPTGRDEAPALCGTELREALRWNRFFSLWTSGESR